MAKHFVLALFLGALLSGCTGGPRPGGEAPGETAPAGEITADAYLFDAQLRRDGKPTSLRLEIYHADSVAGIGGRGYLGKGALKGWVRDDSLLIYFPSTNEYVYEPVENILHSDYCPGAVPRVPLSLLLTTVPDSVGDLADVYVRADLSDEDEPAYTLSIPDCVWRIDLAYDTDDGSRRVKEFEFDNGFNTTFKASRRTLKTDVDIALKRFRVVVPPDAVRLSP